MSKADRESRADYRRKQRHRPGNGAATGQTGSHHPGRRARPGQGRGRRRSPARRGRGRPGIKLDVVNEADRTAAVKTHRKRVRPAGYPHQQCRRDAGLPRTATRPARRRSASLRETFETNFFAVVALTQTLLPLHPQKRCRAHRQPLQHSRVAHAARDRGLAHLRRQNLCLRRVQVRAERLHHPPGPRTARHQNQSQLGAPGMGQDGDGRRRRTDGDRRRRQDQRATRHAPGRRPHRRLLPHGRVAALVASRNGAASAPLGSACRAACQALAYFQLV